MAINAYTGLQGSGKSYEVVSSVIIDAIRQGRRVVTNIDGINQDKIYDYLIERGADQAKLGIIVHTDDERPKEPNFFPDEKIPETLETAFVKPGDMVVIDEAWRFWPDGARLTHEHMQFFRMHRHYVHPQTGVACDVVIMTQDITGLARSLKNVIEFSFRMVKLKSLGMPTHYRVEMFEGWKQNSKSQTGTFNKRYKPEIFPLYKSYSGGTGKENEIDKRQNVLRNPKLWGIIGGFIVLASFSGWNVYKFFKPKESVKVTATDGKHDASAPSAAAAPAAAPVHAGDFSEDWRIVGRIDNGADAYVVLSNSSGKLRVESPSSFQNNGSALIGTIDGQKVTVWTGSSPSSFIPEAKK